MKTKKYLHNPTFIVVLLALLIAGCASPPASAPSSTDDSSAQVSMKGFAYVPQELTIGAGTTVTWTNNDKVDHTISSGKRNAPTDLFNATVAPGASFTYTFTDPGTYEYFCEFHPKMDGTIIVQ